MEEQKIEEEVLKVRVKKGSQCEGRIYRYVDETITPDGWHVVNGIAKNSLSEDFETTVHAQQAEFLFDEKKRKIFYRYKKYNGIEYDHNKYWKEPTLGVPSFK